MALSPKPDTLPSLCLAGRGITPFGKRPGSWQYPTYIPYRKPFVKVSLTESLNKPTKAGDRALEEKLNPKLYVKSLHLRAGTDVRGVGIRVQITLFVQAQCGPSALTKRLSDHTWEDSDLKSCRSLSAAPTYDAQATASWCA